MDHSSRAQDIDEIKMALAVLSVQLEALAARRNRPFPATINQPAEKVAQSFALKAVLAMRPV